MAKFPDTIVIGAGIIGSSIAWKLARAGLRVTLLDAGSMGGEASWAGAGMLAPGGELESRDAWSDLGIESLRMYPEFVAALENESGVSIDYRRCGAVEVAFDVPQWETLRRRAEVQTTLGIASTPLDGAAISRHIPLFDREVAVAGALFYPEDAIVDPRNIMSALRVACTAAGVEIRQDSRVTAIRASVDSVAVECQGDALHAGAAVLAAGAWSTQIPVSGAEITRLPPAFPVRGHLIGYDLQPESLGPILRSGHTYLLQRSGGFTVAGTTSERVGFDRSVDPCVVEDIKRRACELLPWLRGHVPATAWIGFRPAAEASGPVIGSAGNGRLWLAYGHYRNGILLAPVTARQISDQILGVRAQPTTP